MGKSKGRRLDFDKTVELTRSALHRIADLAGPRQQPVLLAIAGPALGRTFTLSDEPMTIGRSHDADIVVVDDGISRRHAVIGRDENDAYYVKDLGSTNGLFINGDRIVQGQIRDGDKIRVGSSTVLKFSVQDTLEEAFQRKMYDSAVRDAMTDTFNKRYFRESLSTDFAYHTRHGTPLSVMMLDIDHFKKINDTHGHTAGDHVLKEVAKTIGRMLRAEDILCRYGGEEFAVIFRGTDLDTAGAVGERIRQAVADGEYTYEGTRIPVTLSIGVATLAGSNTRTADLLVKAADEALYDAKRGGRNRTVRAPTHAG